MENGWLLLAIVGSSLVPGGLIFLLGEEKKVSRSMLNMIGAMVKVALVGFVLFGVFRGENYAIRFDFGFGLNFYLRADPLALLFASLSSFLWLVTTVYAIGYLETGRDRRRFFGFFSLCVSASTGIALAGNVFTFFVLYELLTLTTYPLIVHRRTQRALRAGRTFLWYNLGGGMVLLLGVVWLHILAGSPDFGDTFTLGHLAQDRGVELFLLFWIFVLGLGVKAVIFPLHGWLPLAMVAPVPVGALLHAVAVVKAGVFGIFRVVYDVFGIETVLILGVLPPLAAVAAITVIYGSLRALAQDNLKRRLAYSTVSQLSYITLGIATPGMLASVGALAHLVHQGIIKVTLFFCAGIVIEVLGIRRISQMAGIGQRLPLTMTAFTVGALGMIGLPPIAGFISKWYLGLGGLDAGHAWVIVILLSSSALNAAYFLPILHTVWFEQPEEEWTIKRESPYFEAPWTLLFPALTTAFFAVLLGLFAAGPFSILELSKAIAGGWYSPSP